MVDLKLERKVTSLALGLYIPVGQYYVSLVGEHHSQHDWHDQNVLLISLQETNVLVLSTKTMRADEGLVVMELS